PGGPVVHRGPPTGQDVQPRGRNSAVDPGQIATGHPEALVRESLRETVAITETVCDQAVGHPYQCVQVVPHPKNLSKREMAASPLWTADRTVSTKMTSCPLPTRRAWSSASLSSTVRRTVLSRSSARD